MNPKEDVIVSIAAGRSQLPLIETARGLGLGVIAVDRDERALGFERADARVVCDAHDPQAVLAALEAHQARHRIRAVLTKSSGVPTWSAAVVARALGLPGLEPALAWRALEKSGQLALAEECGVPVPEHAVFADLAALRESGFGPPCVLKPARTRIGKQGVRLARDPAELARAFDEARAAGDCGPVEVERFVPGEDVVLAGLIEGGRFHPLAFFDEQTRFDEHGRARGEGFRAPSRHPQAEPRALGHADDLVAGHHFGTGPAFFSFRVRPDGTLVLIEMHLDLAGDFLTEAFLPAAGARDPVEETIRTLCRESVARESRPRLRPAELRFLFAADLAEGRDAKLAALRELPGALEVNLAVPAAGSGTALRLGYYLGERGGDEHAFERVLGRNASALAA